jgi:hypothetical protein
LRRSRSFRRVVELELVGRIADLIVRRRESPTVERMRSQQNRLSVKPSTVTMQAIRRDGALTSATDARGRDSEVAVGQRRQADENRDREESQELRPVFDSSFIAHQ